MNGRSAMCHAKRWAGILGLGAAVICVGWGCGEDPVEPEPVPTAITISPPSATLRSLDEAVQFRATVSDQNGNVMADVAVTWASSDGSVAAVDTEGLATAAGNGNAMVTASAGAASGSAEVTVAQEVVEVSVSPPADTLVALGDTVQLLAEARDANGHVVTHAEFAWSSGDVAVVTVDAAGLATAVANGSASVTASSGSVSGSAEVTVAQEVVEVSVSPPADTLVALGDTVRLAAEARDANGHVVATAEFAWSSGDEAVDAAGLATAVANGSANVTASSGSAVGSAEVTVSQEVAGVSVSPSADTLVALGDTVRLAAQARDANGHVVAHAGFAWASADEAVVTVDAAGLATAVANGSASVTASSGSGVGSAEVTVAQEVAGVSVSPSADTMVALGDTVRLVAEAADANGHVMAGVPFTWSSGDTTVLAVDSTGLATAVANGTASATATSRSVIGSAALTVEQRAVTLEVSPATDTLPAPGHTLRLAALAHDANGHVLAELEMMWRSSDDAVATVDGEGLVTATGGGSVEITGEERLTGLTAAVALLVVVPRQELVELYEAFDGVNWTNATNWGTDAPLDTWHGVTTDGEGRIIELDLSDNGLSGEIPPELGLLESLEVLDLSGNGVPAGATERRDLVLPTWMPAGAENPSIPRWVSDVLPEVQHGFGEMARGTLQPSAGAAARPDTCQYPSSPLSEPGDGLTGTIPPELGTLSRLRFLDLSDNSLAGGVPPELGNLVNLVYLDLSANHLTGTIPSELGGLDRASAICLDYNKRFSRSELAFVGGLTGPIPPELGNLQNLRDLGLQYNQLTGIPPELGNLRNLQRLDLGHNQLMSFPPELGNLLSLQRLDLYYNQLTSIPPELGNLGNLETLRLVLNQLTSIPPELGNLRNLHTLELSANRLTGIPSEVGNLQNLEILVVNQNQLTAIPAAVGNLHNLRGLGLLRNRITGPIPPELANLENLEGLYVSDNQLTGTIPTELGNLKNLVGLDLSGNQLTGSIPAEMGNLQHLRFLALGRSLGSNISGNGLTGAIPIELGKLENLEFLSLSHTQLTGPIPRQLENLQALRRIYLNDTQLTGEIPAGFVEFRLLVFHWHNTELCAPDTESFQDWLQSISDHLGGVTCASGSSFDAGSRVARLAAMIAGNVDCDPHTPEGCDPCSNLTRRGGQWQARICDS